MSKRELERKQREDDSVSEKRPRKEKKGRLCFNNNIICRDMFLVLFNRRIINYLSRASFRECLIYEYLSKLLSKRERASEGESGARECTLECIPVLQKNLKTFAFFS